MTYVIACFKFTEKNSVYYAEAMTIQAMLEHVQRAFEKYAEFIIIRKIP